MSVDLKIQSHIDMDSELEIQTFEPPDSPFAPGIEVSNTESKNVENREIKEYDFSIACEPKESPNLDKDIKDNNIIDSNNVNTSEKYEQSSAQKNSDEDTSNLSNRSVDDSLATEDEFKNDDDDDQNMLTQCELMKIEDCRNVTRDCDNISVAKTDSLESTWLSNGNEKIINKSIPNNMEINNIITTEGEDTSNIDPNVKDKNFEALLEAEKILIDLETLQLSNVVDALESKHMENISTIEEMKNLSKCEFSRNIGRSTNSLNDNDISIEKLHKTINRSPLSKSAENLTNLPESTDIDLIVNTVEIDSDKIIADFENQKRKVAIPQSVPLMQQSLQEQRFPRSHKEIITQDFGSIVKNVHGIFSSVSGSLKHAYNISQRMPAQQININKLLTTGSLKNVTNARIMNNIFDNSDSVDQTEKTSVTNSNAASPKKDDFKISELTNLNSNEEFSITEEDKIESLEKALLIERVEMAALKERVRQQAEELSERERERKDVDAKMETLRKRLETVTQEKDAAVMRYAVSERSVIGAHDAADAAKRGERAARAEAELLAGKLRSAHAEKQRICQIYDDKCHELATSEREAARVKEELKECENKLKWSQSKLRTEIEAYREAAASVERLTAQVAELEAAKDAAAAQIGDSLRTKQLESELKEARASLILCRHDNEEMEKKLSTSNQQLDSCQNRLTDATAAVVRLEKQVSELTAHNGRLEEEAAELASLRARAALADTLALQLERETERATQASEEAGRERARAETCARRESSALEHAARLTAEHVGERAQLRQQENAARALAADNAGLRERVSALEVQATEVRAALAHESARRAAECKMLARKVAELTEELEAAGKQLEWEKGENSVLRKKHASAVKELNRELQRALKRCEQLESRNVSEPPDNSTPTGSISSLSSVDGGAGNAGLAAEERVNGHARSDSVPEIQTREPDRQTLIERIVQLQRAGARRAERCDFLEEHGRQLTAELRNKTRLLRELLAGQPTGALADDNSDRHKREMARLGGGAMAAVWGGSAEGMTLPLSLEINRKLQAVLEDALLKNITLKKNMDTLGEEIARLKTLVKENT